MSVQLFYYAPQVATRKEVGSTKDSGIFPKRSRNVNTWYAVDFNKNDPSQVAPDGSTPYPVTFPSEGLYQPNGHARIGIPATTACPIFRAQDNGSTDPLLIG